MSYILYFTLSIPLSIILFKFYLHFFKESNLVDDKNPHYANKPAISGSGIIFLIIFLFGNLFFFLSSIQFIEHLPNRYYVFILCITCICLISLKDDIKPIDPILRLIFQIIFVYLSLVVLKINLLPLPLKFSILIISIIWIYIINITNFIDGSDGFLISNFIFNCINILIIVHFLNLELFSHYLAIIALPSSIVFLFYNYPPAKLYMGDSGSIMLGYLNGFFFLELFLNGNYFLSFTLLSYMICDCTITLIKKIKKGIMPWVGMYDYYFLIPTLKNKANHKKVLFTIVIFNLLNSMIIFLQVNSNNFLLTFVSIFLAIITLSIFQNYKKFKIFWE